MNIKVNIYNALILPHLNYGILIWGHKAHKLLKVQKRAVRAITCSNYNAHSEPLFKQLCLVKADDLFTLAKLKFYHKYVDNSVPNYLEQIPFLEVAQTHRHNTRQHNIYVHTLLGFNWFKV